MNENTRLCGERVGRLKDDGAKGPPIHLFDAQPGVWHDVVNVVALFRLVKREHIEQIDGRFAMEGGWNRWGR